MCWSMSVTAGMVGAGAIVTALSLRRGDAPAIPLTLGYFTFMEALQLAGYLVIDQCGSAVNQTVSLLSILHIVFQPFFIHAFAMSLMGARVGLRMKTLVYGLCGLSSIIMLLQLYPFEWAGSCQPASILCGSRLCTVSGDWHLAWDIPYNGLLVPLESWLGRDWGFPSYMFVAFVVPLFYGAWRFVIFHALAGPLLASWLTTNPNEIPAIWCLFSIGIILIAMSPLIRRQFER